MKNKKIWLVALLCSVALLAIGLSVAFAEGVIGDTVQDSGTLSGLTDMTENNKYSLSYEIVKDKNGTYARITAMDVHPAAQNVQIRLPDHIQGYPVKEIIAYPIGENTYSGFSGKSNLTYVEIPYTVEVIHDHVFFDCAKLEAVRFENVVQIGNNAFGDCSALYDVDLSKVQIIGDEAFRACSNLSIVDLRAARSIGAGAFKGCSNILMVHTGEELQTVGKEAFDSCAALRFFFVGFNRPDTFWGENIFDGTNKDLQIVINEGISGWDDCVGLSNSGEWTDVIKRISWPIAAENGEIGILTMIADKVFDDIVDQKITVYDQGGLGYILYEKAAVEGRYAVLVSYDYDADQYQQGAYVAIPKTIYYGTYDYPVTQIAVLNDGQENATISPHVQAVFVSDQIEQIHPNAFDNAFKEGIEIYLEADTKICDQNGEKSLESVWKDKKVVCTHGSKYSEIKANHVYVNYALDEYQKDAQGIFYHLDKNAGYAIVGDYSGGNDTDANTSQYTGSGAYSGESGHAVLPDYVSDGNRYYKVVGIGRYAFYNCNTLEKISLGAFMGDDIDGVVNEKNDVEVNISIGDCSFRNTTKLYGFDIDSRNRVYTTTKDGQFLLEGTYVPKEGKVIGTKLVKAGVNVTRFNDGSFDEKQDFSNVITIEKYALANCTQLLEFDFAHIGTIGEHAFENTSLETVNLAHYAEGGTVYSKVSIENYAFSNCARLKTVVLGDIEALGRFVFKNCQILEGISLKTPGHYYTDSEGTLYEIVGNGSDTYAILLQYPAGKAQKDDYEVNVLNRSTGGSLPIREIEAYAFEHSNLMQVRIGEQINIIGKAAFANCAQLRSIEIGSNVFAIGAEIQGRRTDRGTQSSGYVDDIIAGTYDASKVKVYEREVFDNCSVLSNIIISDENAYYLSDNNGILYNKDKTVLLVYPEGVTRISYTVPTSVTKIGMEAFENNVHIQRLILPEATTEIGAKAFNGCTNLYLLYMRCLDAPLIGDQVFNSAGALSVEGKLTVYCIPEPGVWLQKRAEIWTLHDIPVKKYEAIQEIPDQALPTPDIYLLYIMDSDGNYLPGMKVTYNCTGEASDNKSVLVNSNGYAVLTLPSQENINDDLSIYLNVEDPKEVYYTYTNNGFYLDSVTGFSYITMRSKPGAQGVSCDGEDISVGKVSVNTAGCDAGEMIEVVVNITTDPEAIITKEPEIQLIMYSDSGKEKIITYNLGELSEEEWNAIKETGNYTFKINSADKNVAHHEIGFRVQDYWFQLYYETSVDIMGVSKKEVITEKLNIDLFYYDFGQGELGFNGYESPAIGFEGEVPIWDDKFRMEFEFTPVNEDGEEVDGDDLVKIIYDKSSVYYSISMLEFGERAVNASMGIRDDVDIFEALEDKIEEALKFQKDYIETDFEIDICGVVEYEKTTLNGPLREKRSNITASAMLTFELEYDFHVPLVVFTLPMTVQFDFEGEGAFRVYLAKHADGGVQLTTPEIEITLDIEGRLGIGNKHVSAGIYGSAYFNFVYDLVNHFIKDGVLSLDFGLYFRVKLDLLFYEYTNTFYLSIVELAGWEPEWHFGAESNTRSRFVLRDTETNMEFYSIEDAVSYAVMKQDQEFQVSQGSFEQFGGISPEIVSYNNQLFAFYIDDIYADPDVAGGDPYNYLKLVYSVYDPLFGWSNPRAVNLDLNNEIAFDICADDNGIHILYQRVTEILNDANAENQSKHHGVYAISYREGGFTAPVRLDDGSAYPTEITIESLNGSVYAGWLSNSDYNMFGQSNDSYFDEVKGESHTVKTCANSIHVYAYEQGQWQKKSNINGLPVMVELTFAEHNGTDIALVIQDKDCNISTVNTYIYHDDGSMEEDRSLYYLAIAQKDQPLHKVVFPMGELSEPTALISITYSKEGILVGTDQDTRVVREINGETVQEIFLDTPLDDYELLYKDGALYGIAYIVYEDEGNSNLYVRIWHDGQFSKEVRVTDYEEGTMLSAYALYFRYDAIERENKLFMLGVTSRLSDTTNIEGNYYSIFDNELKEQAVVKVPDLQLLDVWYEKDGLHLTIKNDSLQVIHGIKGSVISDVEEAFVISELAILPGEEVTIVARDFVLQNFVDSYTVTVQVDDSKFIEVDVFNNTIYDVTLVYADLAVDARYIEIADVKYLLVIVQNVGNLHATFDMFVENGIVVEEKMSHDYLYQYHYELTDEENRIVGLAPGAYKYFTIELNKVFFTEDFVTVSVMADRQEKNCVNNIMSFSMEKNDTIDYGETYTVYYYLNGEQILEVNYKAGQTIDNSVLEKFEYREGHEFKGWMNMMDTMPAHDVHVFGLFQVKTYTVNYYVDGVRYDSKQIEYGSIIPQKEMYLMGHSFSGWFIDEACTIPFDNTNMPAEQVNLYGYQQENTYQVYFYLNDDLYQTVSYKYGQIIKLPQYQAQEGHDFKSWTLPNGLTTMPAYDLKLYATNRIKTYTLIYMLDDGNGVYEEKQRIMVQYGQTIPYYDYSAPSGYSFSGWMDRRENGNPVKPETNLKMPNGNLYLYGRNQRKEYTVWYYVGGIQVHSQKVVYGERVPVYDYEADGFYFEGWTNPVSIMPAHDVMVYGNVSTERFKIKYYVDDVLQYTDEFACGATIQIRASEEKEGYSFSGWNECYDSDGRLVKNIPEKMPAYDLHVYGSHTKKEYTVYYYVDSTLWRQEAVKYDEQVSVLAYSPNEGFIFNGFLDAPDRMPANDVYLFGMTQRKAYKLSYYVNGEEKYTETVLFGSVIAPYAYDVPDGYMISDWKNLPREMPAKDIRVDATLSRLTYRIHYYVDGKRIEIVEYAFEDPVKAYIFSPERGYRFNGFINEPETMPDRDMHVYGVTEKETHTVYYYIGDNVVFRDAYAFNDAVIIREAPLLEGYSFVGWNDVPRRMLDEDVHVYGNYIPNEYVLSYSLDGKTVFAKSYTYGSEIETPVADPIEGYTFVGWINEPKNMPSHDVLVVGQLERSLYKVSYYIDDVLLKSETLPWGADVDLSSTDTDKYTVTEWTMDGVTVQSLTVQSKDIRLDATFVEKKAERAFSFAWVLPVSIAAVVVLIATTGVVMIRKSRGRSGR